LALEASHMQMLLSEDGLSCKCEAQVFNALIRWAKNQCRKKGLDSSRSSDLLSVMSLPAAARSSSPQDDKTAAKPTLLDLIRFPLMTPEEIVDYVHPLGLLSSDDLLQLFTSKFSSKTTANLMSRPRWSDNVRAVATPKFKYESDLDKNGVLYWLGTDGKADVEWKNPAQAGKVKIIYSHYAASRSQPPDIIRREVGDTDWTENTPNSWIGIDFLTWTIVPDAYTIRSWRSAMFDGSDVNWHLRHWTLQGSNDLVMWENISEHKNDASLQAQGQTHTWLIPKPLTGTKAFRCIRILQTAANSSGDHWIWISGFEIYGKLAKIQK